MNPCQERRYFNEEVEHRELNNQVQRLFFERVDKLYITMKEMGNPFMEDMRKLLALDTKHVTQRCAAEMVTDGIVNICWMNINFFQNFSYPVNQEIVISRNLTSFSVSLCDNVLLLWYQKSQIVPIFD